jgi:hypothetical protein
MEKSILRRIRERIEDYGSAVAVYAALAIVASDSQSEKFTTTHAWLSQLSGFSVGTVKARLADLQRVGAISVRTTAMKAPSTYQLLARLDNGCQTLASDWPTLVNGEPLSLATLEEKKKDKKTHMRSKDFILNADLISEIKDRRIAPDGCDIAAEHGKFSRWCAANWRQPTKRAFLSWLARCHPARPAPTNRRDDLRKVRTDFQTGSINPGDI